MLPPAFEVPASPQRATWLDVQAPLARELMRPGLAKPRGAAAIRHKLAKAAFFLLHQRLGRPAPGLLRLRGGAAVSVNLANTGFLIHEANATARGADEPEVSALLAHLAPRLGTVLDVGANWGSFALTLATDPRFAGHVHAFEINPATFADLSGVVGGAGLAARITCHPCGVSDQDGEARISAERHSVLVRVVPDATAGRAVPVRRLDGMGLPAPDLVKLDVEGHEAAALRGAAGLLAAHHPLVLLESWHDAARPEAMEEPLRFLEALGYRLYRLSCGGGRLRGQALAAADRATLPEALNLLALHPANAARWL